MKRETEKSLDEQRRLVAYRDGLSPSLCFGDLRQATLAPDARAGEVNALRELKTETQEELSLWDSHNPRCYRRCCEHMESP